MKACSLLAIHFIQSMLHGAMLTSLSSPSPTSPFSPFISSLVILLYQIWASLSFFLSLYLRLFLSLSTFSSISPGITLPLSHHASLRLPQPLLTSRTRWALILRPLSSPGPRGVGPTLASTPASIAPSPHQCLSLPLPPSPAALPSPPASGLPLTEREGRGRRWRPLHTHPPAPSAPHGPAQHFAWPQHRRGPGGKL